MKPEKPRTNLIAVARHAGVSPATVSRVINSTAPVSASARARVLASIAELGYQQAPARPSLGAQPTSTVAILITDVVNPFFPEIIRGIEDEARLDGLGLLLCDTAEDPQSEREAIRLVTGRRVDGIIVCSSRLATREIVSLHQHGIPMVVLNRVVSQPGIPCIVIDAEAAAYRAARHLLELNHTRIAYLAGPDTTDSSLDRRHGLERALAEAGLCLPPEWRPASFPSVDGGFQAMSALLSLPPAQRPTAVQTYNDVMALGALQAVRAHRLRVPEDISVIGFDDVLMAAHTNPPLTTVGRPKYQMGRIAMRMLRQVIHGQEASGSGYTLLESPLVIRQSTAASSSH